MREHVLNQKLWKARCVVYARVCGKSDVVYIGKADSTLRTRMTAHIKGFPRSPNSKAYRKYVNGKTVTIFAYKPRVLRRFGLRVPIHGSIEAALIKRFKRDKAWFVKRA